MFDYLKVQEPHDVLLKWIDEAKCKDPNAMVIASMHDGALSTRTVLAKSISKNGIKFYTNYTSQKALGLISNPTIAVTFFWNNLHRQIHIKGIVKKTSRDDSIKYWQSRSRPSQLSQYISKQSQVCPSKEQLQTEYEEAKKQFSGKDIPCPDHWGGFIIKPTEWELWMGQDHRLHDRFSYRLIDDQYVCNRLYP